MAAILLATILILTRRTLTSPIEKQPQNLRACKQFTVPVSASARNAVYDLPRVNNDIDTVTWVWHSDTWSSPPNAQQVINNITVSDIFNIHVQLCTPSDLSSTPNKSDVLQIATHGLIYDKRYWDAEVNRSTNSYVEASLEAGYSILTYDRLGVGNSDKPDAYTIVQAPLELEILRQLTLMARRGTLYSLAKQAAPDVSEFLQLEKPSKIIHIGHSFGSFLTSALLANYGAVSDGAVITGYIPNKETALLRTAIFGFEYAATSSPSRFSDWGSGYVVPGTRSIVQTLFFDGNPETAFTKEMLVYGELIKQPMPVGEWASAGAVHQGYSPDFEGPLQFMEAEFDFPECAGDCKGTYDLSTLKQIYPNATALDVNIQPNTGHGLTLHQNATAGYQVTFDFLQRHGL